MTHSTPFFNFPLIAPAQAQKHVTHNEAVIALDRHLQLSVLDNRAAPPEMPMVNDRYLVGAAATGAWQGRDNDIAVAQGGDKWLFLTPHAGWRCWTEADASFRIFTGTSWDVPPMPETASRLGIQATPDDVNRLTVRSRGSLFTHDDADDHRVSINKRTTGDTGSVLFQSGFQGHGELGLIGDDDLSFRTSQDGANWQTGISLDVATAKVEFPAGSHGTQFVPTLTPDAYIYGPPNRVTTSYNTSNITLSQDRVHFLPIYVDRPVEINGGLMILSTPSRDSGSVIRAGFFKLERSEAEDWKIGARLADFGTLPADTAGAKPFEQATPFRADPGWYVAAFGTDGAGASFKYARWMTPGQLQYVATGSGSSADLRVNGASSLFFVNSQSAFITDGFPSDFTGANLGGSSTNYHYTRQAFIPHWRAL